MYSNVFSMWGTQMARALEMGHEASNRNKLRVKRRVLDQWKHVVLERKIIYVQGKTR